jgi:hypothetical protein
MGDWRKIERVEREASAPCESWQPLRSLAAAGGELDPAEESRLTAHLSECAACSADFVREKETLSVLAAQHAEPDAALLATCRAGLQDALDREEDKGWIARSFGLLLPSSWISPRPAWSAAILLLIGFSVGLFAPRLLLRNAPEHPRHESPARAASRPPLLLAQSSRDDKSNRDSQTSRASSNSSSPGGSPLQALDLHHATVAGINVLPASDGVAPEVQLQLAAQQPDDVQSQQPYTLQGTVDDGDVRNVLLYVLRHGDLFAPDIRLGAVSALSLRSQNPEVHSALAHAMQQDRSAAVRLKALQALNGPSPNDLVSRMLLDAISSDQDQGIREQAVDTLRDLAESGQLPPSDYIVTALRHHARNDPDVYIRTQSAAVVRELVSQQSGTQ